MTADAWILKIGREDPAPFYFLYGEERFYQIEILQALIRKLITPGNQDFNLETFEAKSSSAMEWVDAAKTLSLLGGRKLVIVRDLHETTLQPASVQTLLDYAAHPSPDACLVVTADKADRKRKLYKTLTGLKTAAVCVAPRERELVPWIKKRAATLGYTLASEAARLMVDRIGAKPGLLASELEKIAAFAGNEKNIDEAMVAEMTGHVKLENVFGLTDALKNKNVGQAIQLLRNQIYHGEEPLKILGAISWQFRLIWEVKLYQKRRLTSAQIAAKMGTKPFLVEKAMKYTGKFSQSDLRKGFESLFQADRDLKTSGKNPELVLESLILKLGSGR